VTVAAPGVAAVPLVVFLLLQPIVAVSVLTKAIASTNRSSFFTAKPSFQEATQRYPGHPATSRFCLSIIARQNPDKCLRRKHVPKGVRPIFGGRLSYYFLGDGEGEGDGAGPGDGPSFFGAGEASLGLLPAGLASLGAFGAGVTSLAFDGPVGVPVAVFLAQPTVPKPIVNAKQRIIPPKPLCTVFPSFPKADRRATVEFALPAPTASKTIATMRCFLIYSRFLRCQDSNSAGLPGSGMRKEALFFAGRRGALPVRW
jgi:hypothetical protein